MTPTFVALALIPFLPIQGSPYPDTPEAVVRALYDRVTWAAPAKPDWDRVREVFDPGAVFSLRLTRDEIKVMNLDGFMQEWLDYAKLDPVVQNGFTERIVRLSATTYGDIANIWVLYEASIPGYMKAPQQGIDICHLVKRNGKWGIVSIVNEIVTKDKPLPAQLQEREQ